MSSSDGWSAEKTISVDIQAGDDPEVEIEANTPTDVEYQHFIDRVAFDRQVMSPGGTCTLSIDTVFAHRGCPITITLKDENGPFRTLQAKMWRPSQTVSVPDDAVGYVQAEADLQKGKRTVASDGVVALTERVAVRDVKFKATESADGTVRDGELTTLQAAVTNPGEHYRAWLRVQDIDSDGIGRTVAVVGTTVAGERARVQWQMDADRPRTQIASQREIDAYGSGRRYVQPTYRVEAECLGIVEPSDAEGDAQTLTLVDDLDVAVVDATTGAALAGMPYTIEWADGTTADGTLDDGGRLTAEAVPPGPCYLSLRFGDASGSGNAGDDSADGASLPAASAPDLSRDTVVQAPWHATDPVAEAELWTQGIEIVAVAPPTWSA